MPRRDLPAAGSPGALPRVIEEVQALIGMRGDPLDQAVTWGQLDAQGFVNLRNLSGRPGGGRPPGSLIIPPGTIIGDLEKDLTPPPDVTGLGATASFGHVIVQWDAGLYTQGHGHGQTNIYAAKRATTDPTNPTFANAVRVYDATGALTIAAIPSELNIRWHIWAKYQTADGVESINPAGGTNGVVAQVGKVGSSDLGNAIVLSQNLAPNSVTADKALLEIGGENLLANNSFEVDANAAGVADGWATYNNSPGTEPATASLVSGRISGLAARLVWSVANSTTKGVVASSPGGVRGGWKPNVTYVVSFYARFAPSAGTPGGMTLAWNTAPATTVTLKNPALLNGTWQRYAFRITWGASVEGSGNLYLSIVGAIAGQLDIDDVQVEEGETLSGYFGKLALNTIVAGDGAIANLAITNALIGTLAVDDAKMVSVSVAKLLAGTLAVGQYIRSTNYVANTSGWTIESSGAAEFGFANIRGTLLAAQIAAGFIAATMLAANSVTAVKIDVSQLDAISATIGTLQTSTSGQRSQITDNGVKVFNSSNVAVIELGVF